MIQVRPVPLGLAMVEPRCMSKPDTLPYSAKQRLGDYVGEITVQGTEHLVLYHLSSHRKTRMMVCLAFSVPQARAKRALQRSLNYDCHDFDTRSGDLHLVMIG